MRKKILFLAGILIIALIIFSNIYGNIVEYSEIGYLSVYFTNLIAKVSIYIGVFIVCYLFLLINLGIAKGVFRKLNHDELNQYKTIIAIATVVVALLCAFAIGSLNYEKLLLYFNSVNFGAKDPIYGKDISFFVFSMPFYKMMVQILGTATVVSTLYTALIYVLFLSKDRINDLFLPINAITHAVVNLILAVSVRAANILIKGFELPLGYFSADLKGAGFTDILFWKIFYLVEPVILVACSVLAIVFLIKRRKKLFIITVAIAPALFIIFAILTSAVQNLYVAPREVTAEAPYISNNIEYTKKAYGISNIEERTYDVNYNLTLNDIKNDTGTIENIRITDNDANLTVANALQAARGYYTFKDMDILPYTINGKTRGVSIAVREMDQSKLDESSKNYINLRLRYTHGYGAVMSTINTVTPEGQPEYIVKDVPLNTSQGAPKINVPQVYYGELTNDYVIVGTSYNELDYMKEGQSVETEYKGKGGVRLSPFNRLFYCLSKGDIMMLFSGYINSDSKVLVNRNVIERASKIAPYLMYDSDPYIVVTEDGRMKWVIDAYTITDRYPYSQPYYGNVNYIRNSVKVIVDAYDGTTEFYITDKNDPLIMAYSKIYKNLFKNEDLPSDIASHIRYPEFLFKLQMKAYSSYHVNEPDTFYSKSDLWVTAREKYNNSSERDVEPYYNIMRIVGQDDDMVLMLPFIPSAKQNLIAWVGASSNYKTFGQMVAYKFPEGSPVYGTLQVENMISSDPEISKEISLWDQGDSNVMKGNLLVIPIEKSILYVEPLYITSGNGTSIPQVKRIIAATSDKVVMAKTLNEALVLLLGGNNQDLAKMQGATTGITGTNEYDINTIRERYKEVKKAMETGDWSALGGAMSALEKSIG
ncbi:MAG: UPF0182 family protein [Bacillota bacterium]|nr:UPF0182 family protein [Bacillota bacterium]